MFKCPNCPESFNKERYFIAHTLTHKEQNDYLDKFMYNSLESLNPNYINGIPKVVFVCWFGGYGIELPEMSPNRFNCFKELVSAIQVPVLLITSKNYKNFVLPDYPLHKAFDYLSGVHKSDYFRCYLLHHYGGGYHDIKSRLISWEDQFEKDDWLFDDNIWMYGRQEKNEGAIAYPPGMDHIKQEYNKLVTMGWIICKNKNLFTSQLIDKIHLSLDSHLENLIKFPGVKSGGYYSDKPFDLVPENSYPIRWLEILGEIYHPLMLTYTNFIKFGLPDANKSKRYK